MSTKKYNPFVSICTPTFNRRPFIENMIKCYQNQIYPKNRMEWIIIDDGTDPIQDILAKHKIQNLKYFYSEKRMNLGEKRNFMHTKTKGSIIVYMDDDDYYPPDRVSHAVEKLTENPKALCAGSSEIYIYFKGLKRMVQFGPYGPNHATAGTFAFRKELLEQTKYEDNAAIAEERAFLKDYTIPFVQLDPMKTILVFSHEHNTFDKRELLKDPHPQFVKDSTKTVEDFIKQSKEDPVKKFFMEDIDDLLANYKQGLPENKPEVLKQTAEIKEKRDKMKVEFEEKMKNEPTGICMDVSGQGQKNLTKIEIVQVIQQQQAEIQKLKQHIQQNPQVSMQQSDGTVMQLSTQQMLGIIQQHQQRTNELTAQVQNLQSQRDNLQTQQVEIQEKLTELEKTHKQVSEEKQKMEDESNGITKSAFFAMEEKYNTLCITHKELELKYLKLETENKIKNPLATPDVPIKVSNED